MTSYTQPLQPFLAHADHVDRKTVTSAVSLRTFVAGFLTYHPAWVKLLYRIRLGLLRLLGIGQSSTPRPATLRAATVPMQPGARAGFFTIADALEDRYWIACASEAHLTAHLAIVAEPVDENLRRFHVVTIVHYHSWAGPLYFNLIRPFHHLVVGGMMRAGAASQPQLVEKAGGS